MNDIFLQLMYLFGYIIVGFVCNKLNVLNATSDKYLSGFILKITLPAAIIASSIGQDTDNKGEAFLVLGIAAVIFLFLPVYAHIFQKLTKSDKTYKLMLTYPNLGFMGLPIMGAMYGQIGVFYASLFMIVFNLSVFSYGVSVASGQNGFNPKKLLSPGILSAVLAILIFSFEIPVAEPITQFLSRLGGITSPLAMITLGSMIAGVGMKGLFRDKAMYVYLISKFIVIPGIIWLVLQFFIQSPVVLGVSTILISLPVAANVSMLTITYGGNQELAAKGTLISTLLSLLTIPVYMLLFT